MRRLSALLLGLLALAIGLPAHAQCNPVYNTTSFLPACMGLQQLPIIVPSGQSIELKSGASLTCDAGATCNTGGGAGPYLPLAGGTMTGSLTFADDGVTGPSNMLSVINGVNPQTVKIFANGNGATASWLQLGPGGGGQVSLISNWSSGSGAPLVLGSGQTQWLFTTLGTFQSLAPNNNITLLDVGATDPISLTGSNAQPLFNIAEIWNTTGSPTLIKANVTNTASGASSLLMDLQINGASAFNVPPSGIPNINGSPAATTVNGTTCALGASCTIAPGQTAKAFGKFSVSGSACTLTQGFNVGTCTYNSAGDYTVAFTTAFADANYTCTATPGLNTFGLTSAILSQTTGNISISIGNTVTQAGQDPNSFFFSCFGL